MSDPVPVPVLGIAGWKNSGKTTLVVRLVEEFSRRGLRISTIKHAHHAFQIDDAGTDSARHRQAGAGEVAIVSPERWAMIGELRGRPEPALAEVIGWLGPCDLILVEGYKQQDIPKIEVRRTAALQQTPLSKTDPHVIAIAADHAVEGERVPVFALDAIAAIADFVVTTLDLKESRRC